jgi:hypothetical protein
LDQPSGSAHGHSRLAARHAESIPELLPAMGLNVIVTVGTPFLLALGFFLATVMGFH